MLQPAAHLRRLLRQLILRILSRMTVNHFRWLNVIILVVVEGLRRLPVLLRAPLVRCEPLIASVAALRSGVSNVAGLPVISLADTEVDVPHVLPLLLIVPDDLAWRRDLRARSRGGLVRLSAYGDVALDHGRALGRLLSCGELASHGLIVGHDVALVRCFDQGSWGAISLKL